MTGVRHYLYPVHPSRTYMTPPSLSAAIALLVLRWLARDYASAFALCAACATDTPPTPEEAQLWALLSDFEDDYEPGSHAVRLKLWLATRNGAELHCPWEVREQLPLYLAKLVTKGRVFGEDMILSSLHLRSNAQAKAMNYLEVYMISRDDVLEVAAAFPRTYVMIRKTALRMAVRRQIILVAKMMAQAEGKEFGTSKTKTFDKLLDQATAADLFAFSTLVTGAHWPAAHQPRSPCPTLKVIGALTDLSNRKQELRRMRDQPGMVAGKGIVVSAAATADATAGRALLLQRLERDLLRGGALDAALTAHSEEASPLHRPAE